LGEGLNNKNSFCRKNFFFLKKKIEKQQRKTRKNENLKRTKEENEKMRRDF